MGMFDYINCDMPLPDGYTAKGFQTKSLDCHMDVYRINTESRLICEHGYSRSEGDTNFHGVLNFYDWEGDINAGKEGETWWWHEYNAKFTDGQCVGIVLHKEDDSHVSP